MANQTSTTLFEAKTVGGWNIICAEVDRSNPEFVDVAIEKNGRVFTYYTDQHGKNPKTLDIMGLKMSERVLPSEYELVSRN